jgi:hypothetical protein
MIVDSRLHANDGCGNEGDNVEWRRNKDSEQQL